MMHPAELMPCRVPGQQIGHSARDGLSAEGCPRPPQSGKEANW